jgi:uncharacterized membrane protein SirB2
MIDYQTLKALHVALVVTSVGLFLARAVPALAADRRPRGWLRAAPHVLDTLLLASGVWLAILVGWNPLVHAWFGVKLALLVVYITLAALALRPAYPRSVRLVLLAGALAAVAGMAFAAVTKAPAGVW